MSPCQIVSHSEAEGQVRRVAAEGSDFTVVQLPETDHCKTVNQTDWPFKILCRGIPPVGRKVLVLSRDGTRWELHFDDLPLLMAFASQTRMIVTSSTCGSGASWSQSFHAQSIPLPVDMFPIFSARTSEIVRAGAIRALPSVDIAEVVDYPVRGVFRISGSPFEVARRVFELAVNYAFLTRFNLIIPPTDNADDRSVVYFAARRRDCRAIYQTAAGVRVQVSAIEIAGIVQAHYPMLASSVDAAEIRRLFAAIQLDESDLAHARAILDSF
jgi:hypothetical protein